MTKFADQLKMNTNRARSYCIAHAACETLLGIDKPKILDLGCHCGDTVRDIQRIIPSAGITGVDSQNFRSKLVLPMRFIHSEVVKFVKENTYQYDLVVCAWILVHLPIQEDDPFWGWLSETGKYLLTYENEVQQGRDLEKIMGSYMIQIRHDTFEVMGQVYEMRVFQKDDLA